MKNHIMMSIDQDKPVLFVLPDLSATFNKVDHKIIFSVFPFYLEQRSQRVSALSISFPNIQCLLSGVPQESVIGRLVLRMYTSPLVINAP